MGNIQNTEISITIESRPVQKFEWEGNNNMCQRSIFTRTPGISLAATSEECRLKRIKDSRILRITTFIICVILKNEKGNMES